MIETLIVVALFGILLGISMPFFAQILNRNSLHLASHAVASSLRRAQLYSQSGSFDSRWGVYITTDNVILFQGDSYALRVPDYDEVFGFTGDLTLSGTTEYTFYKVTGLPVTTGTTTLSSADEGDYNIILNSKGMVEY